MSTSTTTDFDDLFRLHWPRLVRHCERLTREPSAAQDVAQDALATAWTRADDIIGRETAWAWLRTVATNKAIDAARRRGREVLHRDVADHVGTAPAIGDGGVDHVLDEALGRLPHRQRAALHLRYVDDLSVADVARELRVPRRTAEQWLYRALRRLREDLRTMGGQEMSET